MIPRLNVKLNNETAVVKLKCFCEFIEQWDFNGCEKL